MFVLEVLLEGGWARLAGEQLVNRPSAGFVYLAEWIVFGGRRERVRGSSADLTRKLSQSGLK